MRIIPRDKLIVGERQRTHGPERKQKVAELRHSIIHNGLFHPPTVEALSDGTFLLTGGETRLSAIDSIAADKLSFACGINVISAGDVPVIVFGERSELNRLEAEFDENYVRSDPEWGDRMRHLAAMHRAALVIEPETSIRDTAKEIIAKGASVGEAATFETVRKDLARALILEPHLNDPAIQKARNAREAEQLVYQKESNAAEAELIRRRRVSATTTADVRIICGDLFDLFKDVPSGTLDLILSDPPYGINAHNFHKGDRSNSSTSNSHGGAAATNLHNYVDSPDAARKILAEILKEGFRITKPKANLILFTDINHFDWLKQQSAAMGWVPWRRPIIWQKSETEGLITGWGRHGCIMTYDIMFMATKGQKGLFAPMLDILNYKRVARNKRLYSAEKPVDLMKKLLEHTTLPGDYVLDPCAGSGSTLIAARDMKRKALGFEIDPHVCNIAEVRLKVDEATFETLPMLDLEAPTDENNPE